MPKLATIGYRTVGPTKRPKTELFRECLESEGVSLLLDIRDSPWGGYWNPKRFQEILSLSPVGYLFKDEEYVWHKLFGASRKIRSHAVVDFARFRELYTEELFEKHEDPLGLLAELLDDEELVAIMCCEEYQPSHDNCHRFIVAELMVEQGYLEAADVVHLDFTRLDG